MAIELENVASGFSTGIINDNFRRLEEYINDNLLNKDGTETGEANQMELPLDMNSNPILNAVTDPNNPGSLLTQEYADERYVNTAGDTMTGSLDMGGNDIGGVGTTRTQSLILGGFPLKPTTSLETPFVIYINTIADLLDLDTGELVEGQLIQVKEYHAGTGVGGGEFYVSADNSLTPNGGTILRSDDGGATFVRNLDSMVTPYVFGAVGDGTTDDTVPVQEFFLHIAQKESVASICGTFLVTDTIFVGHPVDRQPATKNIDCSVTFISRINIHDKKPTVFFEQIEKTKFTGTIRVSGVSTLADRSEPSVYDGFEFGRLCTGAQFDVLRVNNAHRWALLAERGQIGGGVVIGSFHAENCGFTNTASARPHGTYTLTSVRDDPNSATRSIVTFGGNPLPVGFGDTSYMVSVQGDHPDDDGLARAYEVLSYDEVTGEAIIHPRIDYDFGLGRPMRVGHGGGCFHRGAGANRWNYLNFNCQSVSIGFIDRQMYGNNFYNLHIAQTVIAGVHGSITSRPVYGATFNHVYVEGNAIIRGFLSHYAPLDVTINNATTFDRDDSFMVPVEVPHTRYGLKRQRWGGIFLDSPKSGTPSHNLAATSSSLSVSPKGLSIQAVIKSSATGSANKTVRLLRPSRSDQLAGYTSIAFVVLSPRGVGTGGTLTINADGASTVDGASSGSYPMDTFKIFWCFYDPEEDNWTVNFIS